jgi:hypothetical protein
MRTLATYADLDGPDGSAEPLGGDGASVGVGTDRGARR